MCDSSLIIIVSSFPLGSNKPDIALNIADCLILFRRNFMFTLQKILSHFDLQSPGVVEPRGEYLKQSKSCHIPSIVYISNIA